MTPEEARQLLNEKIWPSYKEMAKSGSNPKVLAVSMDIFVTLTQYIGYTLNVTEALSEKSEVEYGHIEIKWNGEQQNRTWELE